MVCTRHYKPHFMPVKKRPSPPSKLFKEYFRSIYVCIPKFCGSFSNKFVVQKTFLEFSTFILLFSKYFGNFVHNLLGKISNFFNFWLKIFWIQQMLKNPKKHFERICSKKTHKFLLEYKDAFSKKRMSGKRSLFFNYEMF